MRANWKARVIAVEEIPWKYMMPDMVALGKLARENKGKDPPAGVEFYDEPIASKRSTG